ncbi:hypothetical protein CF326_g7864 [Tilletia indica]|nr:hypothetical protein CF326_g7864 [Tilletia indica]
MSTQPTEQSALSQVTAEMGGLDLSQAGARGRGRGRGGGRGRGARGGGGRGGGARFGGSGPPQSPAEEADTALSKTLSYLLRHGAQAESLAISSSGWVGLDAVLDRPKLGKLKFPGEGEGEEERVGANVDDVRRVVRESNKKRFQLGWGVVGSKEDEVLELEIEEEEDGGSKKEDGKKLFIRAVQGHSIKEVSSELLLPITSSNLHLLHPSTPLSRPPPQAQELSTEAPPAAPSNFDPSTLTVVHGTTFPAWERILASGGLNRMGRNHIHLARGLPPSFRTNPSSAQSEEGPKSTIISGLRPTSSILLWIDVSRTLEEGNVSFYLSENGVVLTPGSTLPSSSSTESNNKVEEPTMQKRRGPRNQAAEIAPDGWLSLRYVTRVEGRRGGQSKKSGESAGEGGDAGAAAEWETIWERSRDWKEDSSSS